MCVVDVDESMVRKLFGPGVEDNVGMEGRGVSLAVVEEAELVAAYGKDCRSIVLGEGARRLRHGGVSTTSVASAPSPTPTSSLSLSKLLRRIRRPKA